MDGFFHIRSARTDGLDPPRALVLDGGMTQSIATVALLVREYDEAIAFYRDLLGFSLIADTDMGGGKRWVVVAPPGGRGARLLLARADGPQQVAAIGNQSGGRVMFFLETTDFAADHARMSAAVVSFLEAPRHEPYGSVAVFADLYGNKWDLIEPR
jgi:catechol 2,3-dioxygenase-like lactoylglutathione lyase family enzyme